MHAVAADPQSGLTATSTCSSHSSTGFFVSYVACSRMEESECVNFIIKKIYFKCSALTESVKRISSKENCKLISVR